MIALPSFVSPRLQISKTLKEKKKKKKIDLILKRQEEIIPYTQIMTSSEYNHVENNMFICQCNAFTQKMMPVAADVITYATQMEFTA